MSQYTDAPRIKLTESTDAKNGRLSDPRAEPTKEPHTMNDTEEFFCLSADGLIYFLGNHGDHEAAEETAADMGLDVIWLFGQDTAQSWADIIQHHLKNNLTKITGA
jgi:hypothetical protein